MNLPNAITLSRLVLTVVFVVGTGAAGLRGHVVALIAFTIAAASDWLDGYLARKLGLVTPLGKLLDPLADKILVCAAFVFFCAKDLCPVWVTTLIIAREFLVTGLRQIAIEAGQVLAADNLGKWKTTFQLTFCITGLVWLTYSDIEVPGKITAFWINLSRPDGWLAQISLWTAVALTVISGGNYLWSGRHLLKGSAR
ncbi:CDP-diacylglycerol--glycerol-3-phosphate 3-phosphatidyltransferase [Luteolibacter ambystomatis]|uniref:CDP-diacylglycerol--glycerol-3-phosphate 3-phosphatidyltransferase n=1 Tax=Luteolibacter ambystomatis TaxID=2824561 RepID=A0A975G706_9BACT|nr:CDP-diacylglycerol--glycerol-3-phosphate 3-phosphatidyltransferase [Luteolibacter ambystomatis]QUE50118.1 CDP-diacylglycerol--glycerol-3-phosphate 3-phosphatidyltransferase [Luteolibacter ambystomatis]